MDHFRRTILLGLYLLFGIGLMNAQYYGYPYSYTTYPTSVYQPTFVDLNSYTTQSPYQGQNIQIWPYVIGQYYNPYGQVATPGYNAYGYYNGYNQRTTLKKK